MGTLVALFSQRILFQWKAGNQESAPPDWWTDARGGAPSDYWHVNSRIVWTNCQRSRTKDHEPSPKWSICLSTWLNVGIMSPQLVPLGSIWEHSLQWLSAKCNWSLKCQSYKCTCTMWCIKSSRWWLQARLLTYAIRKSQIFK